MSPWALARLLTSAENVCSACRARMRVRAASHTATFLPSMINRAARNEKVGGMKLFSVPTYPHTKMCEDSFYIPSNFHDAFDLTDHFYVKREKIFLP